MEKHVLVGIFNEIGLLLELKGENPFKTRAYYNAARTLENMNESLSSLIEEQRLRDIPGFGEAIVKKINEWASTGTIEYYDKLKADTPQSLLDLLRIPGLGPKKINQIYSDLGINNIDDLEKACLNNQLAALPGFGAKTQAKICAGIQFIREHQGEYLSFNLIPIAFGLQSELSRYPKIVMVEIAGGLRRSKEIAHDIDLLASTSFPLEVAEYFRNLPEVVQVIAGGETKVSVVLGSGISADLRIVAPREYPHALQHFTGSKEHNTALRHLAKKLGYKVNEYGLFKEEEDSPIYCENEAEIYERLGLKYIPPELREDLGEITAAQSGDLPILIESKDLKGIFHVHTTYSDGIHSLKAMVEASIEKGYSYLGISDHSQIATYAHGLNKEALNRQFQEIECLNLEYPNFKILKGIEADILPSGELDYNPDILAKFDFVIGSVHSQFGMSREDMTFRILKAMDNPFLTFLGHPTGRILLGRKGYEVDLDAILVKAAENGVIIEFNANPYRLDLDWRWCKRAKEVGVLISVNPDAHSIPEIDLVRFGVNVAKKGWLESKDVFNTWEYSQVEGYLQKQKCRRRF